MTKYYHRPLSREDEASILIFNQRFSQLDRAIYNFSTSIGKSISGTAGENIADRDAIFLDPSDNLIYRMDNDAVGKAGSIRGFADGAALVAASVTMVLGGTLDGFSSLTPWQKVYAGASAGSITQTRPEAVSGGGQIFVAEMGIAVSATQIYVKPKPIEYMIRDAMADDDTLTLVHHADEIAYSRKPLVNFNYAVTGASLASYTSSNQDSDVALESNQPTGYGSDVCTGGIPSASDSNGTTPSQAFDNTVGSRWQGDLSGVWLKYDFGVGITRTVMRYTLQAWNSGGAAFAPTSWTFEGSNDNTNWTLLDTQSGAAAWSNSEKRTYDFLNSTAYRYIRWVFTASVGGIVVDVAEAEAMEATSVVEYDKLAQTFTLAGTETIAEVGLWLKKVGSPTGTATLRIETVDGSNNPTGTLAHANASATFNEADLTTSYAEKLVSFSSFSLGAGTYALNLSTSRAGSTSNYIHWGADGSSPGYAGGEMKGQIAGVWSNLSKDAIFDVREATVYHPQKIKVDRWSGTHADMVNQYGDADGADAEMQTTFKCTKAAGFADVTVSVVLD